MRAPIPKLYAIADAGVLAGRGVTLREYAEGLLAAGVRLVQYRNKAGLPQDVLREAAVLAEVFEGLEAMLIMNDRADFAVLAGFDGVHVGQGDISPEDAKTVLAVARMPTHREEQERDEWGTDVGARKNPTSLNRDVGHPDIEVVGVSTHTDAQVIAAGKGAADYVAIGPVFATGTKLDAQAAVGLEGVKRARALTTKPLVAIGGITRENARSAIDAGAESVAVISGLFVVGEPVEKVARDFIQILR